MQQRSAIGTYNIHLQRIMILVLIKTRFDMPTYSGTFATTSSHVIYAAREFRLYVVIIWFNTVRAWSAPCSIRTGASSPWTETRAAARCPPALCEDGCCRCRAGVLPGNDSLFRALRLNIACSNREYVTEAFAYSQAAESCISEICTKARQIWALATENEELINNVAGKGKPAVEENHSCIMDNFHFSFFFKYFECRRTLSPCEGQDQILCRAEPACTSWRRTLRRTSAVWFDAGVVTTEIWIARAGLWYTII